MTEKKFTAPAGMSASSKKHFNRLAKEMRDRWEPHHSDALRLYCETYQDMESIRKELRQLDSRIVVRDKDGQQQISPLQNALKSTTDQVIKLGSELGLFPVSESKSKLAHAIEPEKPHDPYEHMRKPLGF